jgi:penicillin-binding protein 1A
MEERVLNIRQLPRQLQYALRGSIVAVWSACKTRRLVQIALLLTVIPLVCVLFAGIYINFNRTNLPDLDGFIRFQPPTMGHVYDAKGHVLAELGRERREVIQYEGIPVVLREAILSAEDKNFFSHSGVDYSVFPRMLSKTNVRALIARLMGWDSKGALEHAAVFPQGGSTITQQLVRGYFLQKLTSTEKNNTLQHSGILPHVLAFAFGVAATNQFLLKVQVLRLSLWLEEEMWKRYGSKRRAKEELLARYASFIYLGNGRYGFAAASQYYFGEPIEAFSADDAAKAALLAGITKSPGDYAPTLGDNQKPLRRRNQILALMVANHFLSAETALSCQHAPISLAIHVPDPVNAPAAVQNVLDELKQLGPSPGPDVGIDQLLGGHIQVYSTVDDQIQRIANTALENELKLYEKRHLHSKGLIQGSVVVLRNSDSAILAETGGRDVYKNHSATYSDYNRVTQSLRQPGSAMKPIIYLAAFRQGNLDLDTSVPDEPISVVVGQNRPAKRISNFDNKFEGPIPTRQALAESRNAVAVWIAEQIGIDSILMTAEDVGIRTKLQPYVTTALGASEVTLLELANAYRFMASGIHVEPHVIDKIENADGEVRYSYQPPCCSLNEYGPELAMIQEGLRGVVRLPSGTAHVLDTQSFPIPVMGKTGTTNHYRDALFIGSTYGPDGITVAVRIGFDDNRSLGPQETGARTALPVFREIMSKTYQGKLVGPVPSFPADMEQSIGAYLRGEFSGQQEARFSNSPDTTKAAADQIGSCSVAFAVPTINGCALLDVPPPPIYQREDRRGHIVQTNE